MTEYYISYTNPLTCFVHIRTVIFTQGAPEIYLQLPAWRPGRYELQNFAQKIQHFRVFDPANQSVTHQKITKDRWQVSTAGQISVEVHYNFYAHQLDAGGSWLDETQLYVNPVNCLLAVEGCEEQPCRLHLALPADWQIASGLSQPTKHTLAAANYHELIDSPFVASPTLQHQMYQVQNIPFHVWFQGYCRPDWNLIIPHFQQFTEEQMALFGDFPVDDYHFLNQMLPDKFYHGVEHSNSTVIVLGPGELLMARDIYKELLGVSCHELFHAWNIKQIRPTEMRPYDYTRENYFRTGYVAEGVTTYYGDYLLARSGVFSTEQYFAELNEMCRKHFDDFGQYHLSLAEASFDLWLDGYKPGIPDRKVSVYLKGGLAALILDLEIRRATGNQKSLDNVMRRLWQEFGKPKIGYTEQDYQRLSAEVAGQSFAVYFDQVIYGTVPLAEPLNHALQYVGCTLQKKGNAGITEARFGFKTTLNNNILLVGYIEPNSPAARVLTSDDEIIAINGRQIEGNLAILLRDDSVFEVTLFRNNLLRTIILEADGKPHLVKHIVQKLPTATAEQKQNFNLWLKQEF